MVVGRGVSTTDRVSLAAIARTNAEAVRPRRPTVQSLAHELGLLATHVHDEDGRPLRLRSHTPSSSLHIRRFVVEVAGLGICTRVAESWFGWTNGRDALANFDALDAGLKRRFRTSGPRPDLLFGTVPSAIAGEARGRSMRAPASVRGDQVNRLQRVFAWSTAFDGHRWFCTWLWLTTTRATADIFILDERAHQPPSGLPPWPTRPAAPAYDDELVHLGPQSQLADDFGPGMDVPRFEGEDWVGSDPDLAAEEPYRRLRQRRQILEDPSVPVRTTRTVDDRLNRVFEESGGESNETSLLETRVRWDSVRVERPDNSVATVLLGVTDRPFPESPLGDGIEGHTASLDVAVGRRTIAIISEGESMPSLDDALVDVRRRPSDQG